MLGSRPVRILLTGILGFLLVGGSAPPVARAAADRPGPGQAVRDYLARHPGGVPINDNEISYGGGRFIVTLSRPVGTQGVADCPMGWFCFYEWPYFGYPRGKLSDCGWQNLADYGWQYRVESAHYNLSYGKVAFTYQNVSLFTVSTGNRARSDASPYRNSANYVYRYC